MSKSQLRSIEEFHLTAVLYLTGSMGPLWVGGVRIACQRRHFWRTLGRGSVVCPEGVGTGKPHPGAPSLRSLGLWGMGQIEWSPEVGQRPSKSQLPRADL